MSPKSPVKDVQETLFQGGKGEGEGQGKGGDKKGTKGGKPVYTKEELKKIRDEVKEAMVSAAQSTGASNLPGALQRLVNDLTEPKMDWREILQQQIMSTLKSDYTWMRPSRKSWHTSAILPGQNNDEMIDICLSHKPNSEGCDLVDVVYVLFKCNQLTDYKHKDIEMYLESLLPSIMSHYHADYVSPKWAKELDLVGRVGTHIFYRWP